MKKFIMILILESFLTSCISSPFNEPLSSNVGMTQLCNLVSNTSYIQGSSDIILNVVRMIKTDGSVKVKESFEALSKGCQINIHAHLSYIKTSCRTSVGMGFVSIPSNRTRVNYCSLRVVLSSSQQSREPYSISPDFDIEDSIQDDIDSANRWLETKTPMGLED